MKQSTVYYTDFRVRGGQTLQQKLDRLVEAAGGEVCGRMAILAEGDAQTRDDIIYLEKLPVFHADGTVKN